MTKQATIKSKLYGIGVGPGDPELLTLKAIRTLERCDIVAVPDSGSSDRAAFTVVEQYLTGKPLIECRFSMSRDENERRRQRHAVADQICELLAQGKNVGFITLGDPSIYSTYAYVHQIVMTRGFSVEIVPGISSFSAAAASLNVSLCEGGQSLHVLPAGCDASIKAGLKLPGTKVIMKSGKNMKQVLQLLKQNGLADQTRVVSRCTMPGEQVLDFNEALRQADEIGYFSVIIVAEVRP